MTSLFTQSPDRRRWLTLVGRLPGAAHDRARHDDRERRAAVDPARPPLLPGQSHLGHQRVPAHVRQPAAVRRPPRRPDRAQTRVHAGRDDLHPRLRTLRRGLERGRPDRRPLPPGRRRGAAGVGHPRDHRHRVPEARRAGEGDERVRLHRGRGRFARTAARRRPHSGARLALDLLRQHPDRPGDARRRPGARSCRLRPRPGARHRLARVGAHHGGPDGGRLRASSARPAMAGARTRC